MENKKSFVMYASWAAYISELPSEFISCRQ